MKAIKIRDGIYWVGAIDWSVRNFHGYETGRGSTYNAYLIIDEKITLIDSTKKEFSAEIIDRISSVIDPAKIDCIVCNHLEADHSGSIDAVLQHCPNAQVFVSQPNGLKNIAKFCGDHAYTGVKAGDSISIGKRNLKFVPVPMLHWPDSMVTYCPEEKILFSNDGFGQHLATNERFDDEVDYSVLMYEAKKYYANILMLYGRQTQTALKTVAGLDIDMILTGHGISWRSHIKDILNLYNKWSNLEADEHKALVVFDSMWHSTELIAKTITEAFHTKGIRTKYCDLKAVHYSDIVTDFLDSKYIAVGSPTLNNNMMPNVAAFLCYLKGLTPKKNDRKALAFGSYGWGGQSIALVQKELEETGLDIFHDMIRIANQPTKEELDTIYASIIEKI